MYVNSTSAPNNTVVTFHAVHVQIMASMYNGLEVWLVSAAIRFHCKHVSHSKIQIFACPHLDVRKLALDLSIHFLMPHNVKQKDEQPLNQ